VTPRLISRPASPPIAMHTPTTKATLATTLQRNSVGAFAHTMTTTYKRPITPKAAPMSASLGDRNTLDHFDFGAGAACGLLRRSISSAVLLAIDFSTCVTAKMTRAMVISSL
jgi:hypothetical protein